MASPSHELVAPLNVGFDGNDVLLHTFESSALIGSTCQYAVNKELEKFAERFITVEQPQRGSFFFTVL